ncbi:hypothetical protein K402DRAFT_400267 [Aulographum hederae CBS 113979]|uniref:Uncharacterized protein n=1 Tax=Aulographum hederae CBS 113979 TaxID=1176131 RepID=A0A6G1HEF0_9PEZI|nr:hypothetical protein K402DRAFT_400267 [Aulographum hederae CBS 113979]
MTDSNVVFRGSMHLLASMVPTSVGVLEPEEEQSADGGNTRVKGAEISFRVCLSGRIPRHLFLFTEKCQHLQNIPTTNNANLSFSSNLSSRGPSVHHVQKALLEPTHLLPNLLPSAASSRSTSPPWFAYLLGTLVQRTQGCAAAVKTFHLAISRPPPSSADRVAV